MVQASLRQAYVEGLNSDIVTFIISASHSDLQQFLEQSPNINKVIPEINFVPVQEYSL